jgi:cell division protein FtsB
MSLIFILLIVILIFLIGNFLLVYLEVNRRKNKIKQLPLNSKNINYVILESKIDVLNNKVSFLEQHIKDFKK